MGNCCSTEHPRGCDEQIFNLVDEGSSPQRCKRTVGANPRSAPSSPRATAVTAKIAADPSVPLIAASLTPVVEAFARKLEDASVGVLVLLASGMGIECHMKLDKGRKILSLSRDDNYREIALNQIKGVLHTAEELSKIEIKADPSRDASCSALWMVSGNCITLRFDNPDEKSCFVSVMERELGDR